MHVFYVRIKEHGIRFKYQVPENPARKTYPHGLMQDGDVKCTAGGERNCMVFQDIRSIIHDFSDVPSFAATTLIRKSENCTYSVKSNASSCFAFLMINMLAMSGCNTFYPFVAITDCYDFGEQIEKALFKAYASSAYALLHLNGHASTSECVQYMRSKLFRIERCLKSFMRETAGYSNKDCVRNGFVQLLNAKLFFDECVRSDPYSVLTPRRRRSSSQY